jgi:hypothetical protein
MMLSPVAKRPPPERGSPAERRIAFWEPREQAERRMRSRRSTTRTLVNPGPRAVRLVLSDGSERIVGPWGLAIVPRSAEDGKPVEILEVFVLERRRIPGADGTDEADAGRWAVSRLAKPARAYP